MKKIPVLLALLSLGVSVQGFAQAKTAKNTTKASAQANVSGPAVFVTLGRLIPVIDADGKRGITATRAELLANTRLSPTEPNCTVRSFEFSILPTGGDLIGPFYATGGELTNQMKTLISANTGMMFIENITLKCGDKNMAGQPILLKYDH